MLALVREGVAGVEVVVLAWGSSVSGETSGVRDCRGSTVAAAAGVGAARRGRADPSGVGAVAVLLTAVLDIVGRDKVVIVGVCCCPRVVAGCWITTCAAGVCGGVAEELLAACIICCNC